MRKGPLPAFLDYQQDVVSAIVEYDGKTRSHLALMQVIVSAADGLTWTYLCRWCRDSDPA